MDPLAAATSGYSPYHANYNNPVMFTDRWGLYPDTRLKDFGGDHNSENQNGNDYLDDTLGPGAFGLAGAIAGPGIVYQSFTDWAISNGHYDRLPQGHYQNDGNGHFTYSRVKVVWRYSSTKKSFHGKQQIQEIDADVYNGFGFYGILLDFQLSPRRPEYDIIIDDPNLVQRWMKSFRQIFYPITPKRTPLTPLQEDRRLQRLIDKNNDAIETNDPSVTNPLDPNEPLDIGNTNPTLGRKMTNIFDWMLGNPTFYPTNDTLFNFQNTSDTAIIYRNRRGGEIFLTPSGNYAGNPFK